MSEEGEKKTGRNLLALILPFHVETIKGNEKFNVRGK
jgi:hypothetical protein